MKSIKILTVFFVIGIVLIFPLFRSDVTVSLFPEEKINAVVNIHGNKIVIRSDIQFPIKMNISEMNAETDQFLQIWMGEFISEETIDIEKNGFYLFEFFAESIANIDISSTGIPLPSIFYLASISIIMFINYVRLRFFTIITEY